MRILHFGDVHLPLPPGAMRLSEMLHPKRLPALLNFWARRGTKYRDGVAKLNALGAFLRAHPADWILYGGDSVNFGLRGELIDAAPRISGVLEMARKGAVTVPGNHDLYTGRSVKDFQRWFSFGNKNERPDLAVAQGGFPRVRFLSEEVVCVTLSSSLPHLAFWDSSGRVPARELEALKRVLDDPEIGGRPYVLILTHYPLDEAGFFHGLRNANEVAQVLHGRKNLHLLNGHNHAPYSRFLPGTEIPVHCAGSLSKKGCESFLVYEPFGGSLNPRRARYAKAAWTLEEA